MNPHLIIANGKPIEAQLPCSIEEFLVAQNLLPRSVVVELNGEAVEMNKAAFAWGRRAVVEPAVGRPVLAPNCKPVHGRCQGRPSPLRVIPCSVVRNETLNPLKRSPGELQRARGDLRSALSSKIPVRFGGRGGISSWA